MITLDLSAFENMARAMDGAADQMGFAISRAINKAVVTAENRLANETWPSHIQARNRSFLKAALKPKFSTKKDLRVELNDTLGRAHLGLHARGGTKQAKGQFAIPTRAVTRTAKGVRQNQKPRNLKDKVVKGGLIFAPQGRGKKRRLTLMFKLQAQTRQPKDVPFYSDFARFMREEAKREFPKAMLQAMQTRRR